MTFVQEEGGKRGGCQQCSTSILFNAALTQQGLPQIYVWLSRSTLIKEIANNQKLIYLPPWKFAYRAVVVLTSKYIWIEKPVELCCLRCWRAGWWAREQGRLETVDASSFSAGSNLPCSLFYKHRLSRDGSVITEKKWDLFSTKISFPGHLHVVT